MLTADLAMSRQRGDRITPLYLEPEDANYAQAAEDLIGIVRRHLGRRRAEMEKMLDEYIGIGTDYRIMRGLIKLLADRCKFETSAAADPVELRQLLFLRARERHPVAPESREALIAELAESLGIDPAAIPESLYADLAENQRLTAFDELEPHELIDQYNLAQAQALLYRCVEMTLWLEPQPPAGYRQLFDAIKRFGLIHAIRGRAVAGYEVTLSGPVSLFHRSQKYGIQMSVFLPALLECEAWRMRAEVETKYDKRAFYDLDSRQQRLRDSLARFTAEDPHLADKLLDKWPSITDEWRLERSRDVIDLGRGAFAPDLVATHADGRRIHIELMGFWTPRYLKDRLEEFAHDGRKDFLLAVSEELRGTKDATAIWPAEVLTYKASLDARTLLAAIERAI